MVSALASASSLLPPVALFRQAEFERPPSSLVTSRPSPADAAADTSPHSVSFRCPFEAIQIINLPTNLESQVTHRYTANSFKLHRLPTPRPGQVLGLVGTNGIGKSTALKILAGKMKPNLGRYDVRRASVARWLVFRS